ncbi:MAG TPA: calcium-binding protein [Allosphingosinicella sp.]
MPHIIMLPGQRDGPDNIFSQQALPYGIYTLAAGAKAYGSQYNLFWSSDSFGSMVNHGTIWNIGQTGSFAVGGLNLSFVENDGLIVGEAPNGNAGGVFIGSRGDHITNSGRIFAIANGNATAVENWDPGVTVTNTGTIAAYTPAASAPGGGGVGGATGVAMFNGGRLVNGAGASILAEGLYATAVIFSRGDLIDPGIPQIRNAGLIEAYATAPGSESIAILTGALSVETLRIENSGIIRADVAYRSSSELGYSPPQQPGDQIYNLAGGQIYGLIDTRLGNDIIINSGAIHGNLKMGEGDDVVSSAHGTLDGIADLGWGDDYYVAGDGDNQAMGGRDSDWMEGGAGQDLLLGGLGDDTLIGGTGNDGLYGEYGNDRIVTAGGDLVDAGAGDDVIEIGDLAFRSIEGGSGFDRLVLAMGMHSLDLASMLASGRVHDIEAIEMRGQQRLVVRAEDVHGLSGGDDTLRLLTTGSDKVELIGSWGELASVAIDGVAFRRFTLGGEIALVAGAGDVTIAASPSAPAGGLDPIASGASALLPDSVPGMALSSTVTVLNNYALHHTETIQSYETWRSEGGQPILWTYGWDYSLINYGLIESIGPGNGGAKGLFINAMDRFINYGTMRVVGTGSISADGMYYGGGFGGLTNYGLIEVTAESGHATGSLTLSAVWDEINFQNFGTITARTNGTQQAIGAIVTRDDQAYNDGTISALGGNSTTGVQVLDQRMFTNRGTITADVVAGVSGSATGLFYVPGIWGSTFYNYGLIQGDKAIEGGTGLGSAGPTSFYNFGRLEGSITLESSNSRFENWGVIVGEARLGAGKNLWFEAGGQHQGAVFGGDGTDMLVGTAAADTLNGDGGDDYLRGGAGADQLSGGTGKDIFVYTDLGDSTAVAFDTITDFTSGSDRIDLTALGVQSISIQAGAGFTLLNATTAQGVLEVHVNGALAQSDVLLANVAILSGTGVDDVLCATAGGSIVNGGDGNDLLIGAAGLDRLDGGTGSDFMWGGAGNDIYVVDSGGDLVWELSDQGTDLIELNSAGALLEMPDNVENVTMIQFGFVRGNVLSNIIAGSAGDDGLNGNAGQDILSGDGGKDRLDGGTDNDILVGGVGADLLIGGAGADTFRYLTVGDSISGDMDEISDFQTGVDLIDLRAFGSTLTSISWSQQAGIADSFSGDPIGPHNAVGGPSYHLVNIATSAGTMTLRVDGALSMSDFLIGQGQEYLGTPGADTLTGSLGDDMLNGLAGADTMIGKWGNDTYFVDDFGDTIIEAPGEGYDVVAAGVPYVLGTGVSIELLTTGWIAGTAAIDFTGNALAHQIWGNDGVNILNGSGGNDELFGFGGNDTLIGGTGNDTMFIDSAGDIVVEAAGEGYDTLAAGLSYTLGAGVEIELITTGFIGGMVTIDFTGNEFANQIWGNGAGNSLNGGGGNDALFGFGGNDILVGGTGADLLAGGTGNDSMFVDDAGDIILEAAGEGFDVVAAGVTYALGTGAEVELLTTGFIAGTAAIDFTGNEFANQIWGNDGVNILNGGGGNDALFGFGGNDTLNGGAGDDTMFVDNVGDIIVEAAGQGNDTVAAGVDYTLSAGAEIELITTGFIGGTAPINFGGNELANQIWGNDGANSINGGGGNDALFGFGGNDTLNGGTGSDALFGGNGADTFAFTTALGAANVDLIADFVSGTDKIALDDAIFTGLGLGALNANAFVNGSTAQDADDRILYDAATGNLFFDADGNGAGAAVLFATLQGHPVLAASDFQVI